MQGTSRSAKAIGSAALGAAALLLGVGLPGSSAAVGSASPTIGTCTVYPSSTAAADAPSGADQTAWNQDVSAAPVARNSKKVIAQINRDGDRFLHPDFGSNLRYGIPFVLVEPDQPSVEVTIGPRGFPEESDFGPAPVPLDAPIENGDRSKGDRHVIVVQNTTCALYELYRAFRKTGSWQADGTAFFDLNQPALVREEGFTSADAAGLPIFPGLIRYDEVAAGAVNHAIRVVFDRTRRAYVRPALHYASDSCNRNRPSMGMRFRLKPGYYANHLSDYPEGSQSRVIFETLFRYGMINADNGSNWFIGGGSDSRWDDDDLNRLKDIPGAAFQVIQSEAKTVDDC